MRQLRLLMTFATARVMSLLIIVTFTLIFALPAVADSITLDSVSGNSQGGVYTAPYFVSINGGADIAVMCVDFDHHLSVGETWDATLTNMAGDLSNTRLGVAGFATYREEAWLYEQFLMGAASSGDINYAVWALTSTNAVTSPGWSIGAQNWFNLATTTDLTGFDSTMVQFTIITPTDLSGAGPQEFLSTAVVVPTPEPGGLFLLGGGMLGLAGFARKKIS